MSWSCCYTRKGCWLARLGRVSVAVVHGWTDETAHLEYAKSKSNPRKKKMGGLERVRTLLENMTTWLRQEKTPCWRSVDAQGARNFFWTRAASWFHVWTNHDMFKREEETIDTKPSRWPGHRQAARHHSPWQYVIMSLKSPTKNTFYLGKQPFSSRSHLKRSPTQNHFHQDRPHHKMIEKVQRKTHFT